MPEFIVTEKVEHYNVYRLKSKTWKAAKRLIEQATIRENGSRDLDYRGIVRGKTTCYFRGHVQLTQDIYDPEIVSVDSGDRQITFFEKDE